MSGLLAVFVVFVVIGIFSFDIFVWALCRIAKPAPPISRRAAKRQANKAAGRVISQAEFAEGRPTMPSTPEPEDERARRRAPIQVDYSKNGRMSR